MKYLTLTTVLLSSVALCGTAHAQTTAPVTDAEAQDSGITDIIVTAQRQSESSQRAAIAISVLQPEQLEQVKNPEDLSVLAPSLQISNGGGISPLLYVRGVGTQSSNPYTDSAVAVNYDGVYLGRPSSTRGIFYDLERIEVLKGPQGTLYGRNATGGAINVIPATPKIGERSLSGSFSIGNWDSISGDAAVNVPVSDTVAIRLSGTAFSHGAYNTDGTWKENGAGGRAQILFKPSEDVSLRLAADYFHLGGTGPTGVLVGRTDPATRRTVPVGFGPEVGAYDPRSAAIFNAAYFPVSGTTYGQLQARPRLDNEYYGLHADLNVDLGFANLAFLGAYRRADVNAFTQPTPFLVASYEKDEQISGELRLSGDAGPIDWLVGAYYFDENVDGLYVVNNNINGGVQQLNADNRSYAGFGRLTWNVTDSLRLTGAARYTKDEKSFVGESNGATAVCQSPAGCPGVRRLPGTFTDINAALASIGYIRPPGVPVYIDALGTSNAIYAPSRIVVNGETNPDKITYRAGVEFEPGPASLLYASIETGYRSGGFSFSSITPIYQPETITAYTIGSKNRFLDNKLQFNIEAFLWEYKDQQVAHFSTGATGGIEFITENVGRSINKGIELEVVAKPLTNTMIRFDAQYLDAKNKEFQFIAPDNSGRAGLPAGTVPPDVRCPYSVAPGGNYLIDCSGLRALRSPKWTINFGAQQTIPLGDDLSLVLEGNTHYQTRQIIMFERREFSEQTAYWQTDAAITLNGADDAWSLQAFVNNIENKRRLTNTVYSSLSGVTAANVTPPRTYGLRFGFKF